MGSFRVVCDLVGKDLGLAERVDKRGAPRTARACKCVRRKSRKKGNILTDYHEGELDALFGVFAAAVSVSHVEE